MSKLIYIDSMDGLYDTYEEISIEGHEKFCKLYRGRGDLEPIAYSIPDDDFNFIEKAFADYDKAQNLLQLLRNS